MRNRTIHRVVGTLLVVGGVAVVTWWRNNDERPEVRRPHDVDSHITLRTATLPHGHVGHVTSDAPQMVASDGSQLMRVLGITADDLAEVNRLNQLAKSGEFICQNERPTTRKFLTHDFSNIVANASIERSAEYKRVFAQSGLGDEESERLQRHLAKIHLVSLEAEVAIQQVLDARMKYDASLKRMLTPDAYNAYRKYEAETPAVKEMALVTSDAHEQGVVLPVNDQQMGETLIQEAKAYTTTSYYGPYDGLPDGVLGVDNVLRQVQEKRNALANQSAHMMEQAKVNGVSDALQRALQLYFNKRLMELNVVEETLRQKVADGKARQ